jgi:hypothetical protein
MLVIIGMILLLTWIFDHALHLTPDSIVNLLLIFASISFALDYLRERDVEPRPGWDDLPPKSRLGALVRWIRRGFDSSTPPTEKSAADGKGGA